MFIVFLQLSTGMLCAQTDSLRETPPVKIKCELKEGVTGLGYLSWDTEGGDRVKDNLLLPETGISLHAHYGNDYWKPLANAGASVNSSGTVISQNYSLSQDGKIIWTTTVQPDGITFDFSLEGAIPDEIKGFRLLFPFNPRVTPTTVIPDRFGANGHFNIPVIASAPDFGQMRLEEVGGKTPGGLLLGDRASKIVHMVIELPLAEATPRLTLRMTPYYLEEPAGLVNHDLWKKIRRPWFNPMQTTCRWGDTNNPWSAPAGLLANNVVSDPASCSLWFYADQAFWTPRFSDDISIMNTVRSSIDFWLDKKVKENGEIICYWSYAGFLDANAGPIIAAWDYHATTNDREWLEGKIERLEFVADYLAKRDIDGDGMVEAIQSGNYGTLVEPNRSCAWWDALNCGHKDGYTNAIIFRAWCCLSDLENKLGRHEQSEKYADLAKKLKASYADTLRNPETGWLAWWKSEDGTLHDYASPVVNGMAIEYGLVSPEEGRVILKKLWAKMDEAGFKRFDLGVPPMLVPVLRADYLLPNAIGCPQRDDGTDTVGHYMNGGITAGQVFHFLAAHYVVGMDEKADFLLEEMLKRQAEGKFQNGVTDAAGHGIDWTDWNGNPTGYEGYLAESSRFLQAIMIREPQLRAKYYAPILNLR